MSVGRGMSVVKDMASPHWGPRSLKKFKRAWSGYSYRVPYCVPYWNGRTYRAIFRCLAMGRVVHGTGVRDVETRLARFFSAEVRGYSQGRVALEAALRGLGVGRGDEVVLPTFCCTSVVPPVLATGALPVLADVGPELNLTPECVDAVLTSRTRAIVVPHLFGNPADIEAIEALARSKEIKVIDDAAQAFGATSNGKLAGTFGDAGIVSFGNGKVCFGTGGGILISRTEGLIERAKAWAVRPSSARRQTHNALSTLLWRRWRRRLLPFLVAGRRLNAARKEDDPVAPQPYSKELMSNLEAVVILSLLETLDQNLAARRRRIGAYRELLEGAAGLSLVPHGEGSACLTQVVSVRPLGGKIERSDTLLSRLRNEGYEVKGSYIPLHVVPAYSGFAKRKLHHADRIWRHLIELPCEPDVPMNEVERIAAIVRAVLVT